MKGQKAVTARGQRNVIAGYCRVSTGSDEQSNALVVQKDAVKRYGVDVLYEDVLSGAGVYRPGYEQLKDLVATRQVSQIVINNVSRLGRDFAEAIAFVAMCDEQSIDLISLDQPDRHLTLRDSTDLLMTIFPMALAATYKLDNTKKISAGFANGRKMAKPMRKACFGYQVSKDRMKFEPSEHFGTARRFIDCLIANQWKMRTALMVFDWGDIDVPFSASNGVRAWLLNPTLRGITAYQQLKNHRFNTEIPNTHQALLTTEEFKAFNAIIKLNRKMWGHNAQVKLRPLTSLTICHECGKHMSYAGGRTFPSVVCKTTGCSQQYKSTREDEILEHVIPAIRQKAAKQLAQQLEDTTVEDPKIKQLELALKGMPAGVSDIIDQAIDDTKRELEVLRLQRKEQKYDPEVERVLADPRTWNDVILPDREKLTVVLHEQVSSIVISKQEVHSIDLKPVIL